MNSATLSRSQLSGFFHEGRNTLLATVLLVVGGLTLGFLFDIVAGKSGLVGFLSLVWLLGFAYKPVNFFKDWKGAIANAVIALVISGVLGWLVAWLFPGVVAAFSAHYGFSWPLWQIAPVAALIFLFLAGVADAARGGFDTGNAFLDTLLTTTLLVSGGLIIGFLLDSAAGKSGLVIALALIWLAGLAYKPINIFSEWNDALKNIAIAIVISFGIAGLLSLLFSNFTAAADAMKGSALPLWQSAPLSTATFLILTGVAAGVRDIVDKKLG